jgi:hypothetical protein
MNILTNSASKRNKGNAFHILSNSNNVKKRENRKENKNGINVINGISEEDEKVNFFEKPKIYNVKFYYLYNQNFSKEEENLFKSFNYFTRNSKNKIKKGSPPTFHIVLGKEYLKKATQVLSIIPNDQIVINANENTFSNVTMIHLGYSAGTNVCESANINQFNEFPIFHLELNTNKAIKYCNENDKVIKEVISLITHNSVKINKNNSLSASGNILTEENVNYSGVQNNLISQNQKSEKVIFETQSLVLKYINQKYYKLFQKNPQNTLFIKKELLNKLFSNHKLYLKEELFNKLKLINKNLIINDQYILSANIQMENNNVKLVQKSMVNYGSGFLEFYKNKKNEFMSNLLKKYLMALYYIENLKHRNISFEINSNIFKDIKEFQNSYYLGFDLEYIIINHLKKNGVKPLLIPFIAKYDENKYILYYLYMVNKNVYLYEINNNNCIEEENKINNKVENYFKRIFAISFISKSPMNFVFKGLMRKNMEFKINFVDENKLKILYTHLHLFYKILNPQMELKELFENKGTDEMLKFITLLLEL